MAWLDFLQLFFPNYCLACHGALVRGENTLCTRCLRDLPKTRNFFYPSNDVAKKFYGKLPVHTAISFLRFHKGGLVQHLMHALKYENHPEIAYVLGKIYGEDIRKAEIDIPFDMVVPVPLHPIKQKRRGYNQSDGFAKGLAEVWQIDWSSDALQRRVFSESQTRKNRLERWKNVEEVFHVKHPDSIRGKHILVVDDVITTGATMEACGLQLLQAGAAQVSMAAIAMATST
jgi:ComF family protein